ncbi:MAG: tRNA-dihydrouridine synthase [Planctomycetota bacterium]
MLSRSRAARESARGAGRGVYGVRARDPGADSALDAERAPRAGAACGAGRAATDGRRDRARGRKRATGGGARGAARRPQLRLPGEGRDPLTVHCRTRAEAYRDTADWERLRRAVRAVSIPVCGNGGVATHADLARLRAETGCAYTMVGRAALGDPWIFSGRRVTATEAADFLLRYGAELARRRTGSVRAIAGRIKQLLRHWTAGDLCGNEHAAWLALDDETLLARLIALAGPGACHPREAMRAAAARA